MWLLEREVKDRMLQAEVSETVSMAKSQAEYLAQHPVALAGAVPAIMSVAGDKAQIEIKGILTNTPNFMAMFFGGGNTTYSDIIAALGAAESDDSITDITLAIDSPGGHISGLFDAMNAIAKTKKPVVASVSNLAASATFGLASQADKIIATNNASMFGSVGIAAKVPVFDDVVTITSTNAPDKIPDVTTTKGVAVVKKELDAIHDLFVENIAAGRSRATGRTVTVGEVNANFGQGATVLAKEALKRGMIDSIAQEGVVGSNNITGLTETNNKTKEGIMDLAKFKTEHPDIYQAVLKEGEDSKLASVLGHLSQGKTCDAMDIAIKAIKDGTPMTEELRGEYLGAALKKRDVDNRGGDDDPAKAALAGGEGLEEPNAEKKVMDGLIESFGGGIE